MLRRRKYESHHGFTLVELVVVLVILAILTSVAVPAFSHQIDDAKEKKAVTEAQACVTAATGLTAQKYTEARTAYIQDNSKDIAVTLADWAGKVQDARPSITGTLAQREGTGEYLLAPQGTPDGSAAGVDGTVLNFWCNTNGQIVYLLYKSADDILVAYANDANSGSNGIVIPTANVPTPVPTSTPTNSPIPTVTPVPTVTPTETATPEPTPTATPEPVDSNGQIKIYCYDEDGNRLGDVQLFLKCYGYNSEDGTRTSSWNSSDYNARGFDIFDWTTDTQLQTGISYYIVETSVPQYYQRVLTCGFTINRTSNGGYSLSPIQKLDVGCGRVEFDSSDPQHLVISIYHKPLQMLTIHRETADGAPLANAVFTITSRWDNSNTPILTCQTDANGDAKIPLEYTIADNNQHWYAPRFQSLNNMQSMNYRLTETKPSSNSSSAAEVPFTIEWSSSLESYTLRPGDYYTPPANVTFSGTTITISG